MVNTVFYVIVNGLYEQSVLMPAQRMVSDPSHSHYSEYEVFYDTVSPNVSWIVLKILVYVHLNHPFEQEFLKLLGLWNNI